MDRLHPQLLIGAFRRTFVRLSPGLQVATFSHIARKYGQNFIYVILGNFRKCQGYTNFKLPGVIIWYQLYRVLLFFENTISLKYQQYSSEYKKYSSEYKRAGYATGSIIARTSAPDSSQASTRSFILAIIPISHISLLDFFQNCFGFHHEVFWIYWLF